MASHSPRNVRSQVSSKDRLTAALCMVLHFLSLISSAKEHLLRVVHFLISNMIFSYSLQSLLEANFIHVWSSVEEVCFFLYILLMFDSLLSLILVVPRHLQHNCSMIWYYLELITVIPSVEVTIRRNCYFQDSLKFVQQSVDMKAISSKLNLIR